MGDSNEELRPARPDEARDAAEFVALMRQLKERTGLTYRQLKQRAADHGSPLHPAVGSSSGRPVRRISV